MALWTTRVLKVLDTHHYKGELKYKWEIVRAEDGEGKHMQAGLVKNRYYTKDGVSKSFPEIITSYDMKWIDSHRKEIDECLASDWKTPEPTPTVEIGEEPF